MSLVVIEGDDGMGKTSLIAKLKQKYPDSIEVMAFPSEKLKKAIQIPGGVIPWDDIELAFEYHLLFMDDFIENQEKIFKLRKGNRLVLIDRYFLSNFVYLCGDMLLYQSQFDNSLKAMNEVLSKIWEITTPLYTELEQPDLWIDLYSSEKKSATQILFDQVFKNSPENTVHIKALQPDTFDKVENILIRRGFL
jgi:deoxyadenosine/deoxycytidine kinase